ncbi:MAG TPA: hypothetical protein DD706_17370, partial [Nitrospiraceae bacterium]|nr:hypothetical protein [Nitrospiraceae bacterium]
MSRLVEIGALIALVMFLLVRVSMTWAQDSVVSWEEDESLPIQMDEVVVTASELPVHGPPSTSSRLGLTSLETPASIHIIDHLELKNDGYKSVSEAIEQKPGITWGAPPGDPFSFSMRGFTENQITILRDGLWLGPATMTGRPQNGFNVRRIELLKGPASVLHGQGAIAGTLNVLTKKPVQEPHYSWEGLTAYGSYHTVKLGAGAGGPLGEALWYRADLSFSSSDGYVKEAGSRSLNGTGELLWKPVESLEVTLGFDYLEDTLPNYWGTPLVSDEFGTKPLKGVVETTDGRTIDERMRFVNYNVANKKANSHQYLSHMDIHWKPSQTFSLNNTVYYFSAERRWRNAETYTFNDTTNLIDRDRFFVSHDQQIIGNRLYGMLTHHMGGMPSKSLGG